jgi:type IV pilus assembly protein PilX
MRAMKTRHQFRDRQAGAVLIVGLVILLVLTLIGVTAMRSSLLEERMTGNIQDNQVAFQAAEAALRDGELALQQPTLPDFNGTDGFYGVPAATDPPRWKTLNWDSSTAVREYEGFDGAPGSLAGVSVRYFVEEMPLVIGPGESLSVDAPVDEVGFYRVTARGVGVTQETSVVLQTTYKR